jgi:hypothetical protein
MGLLDFGWRLLQGVTNDAWKELLSAAGYSISNQAAIFDVDKSWGISRNILRVYEHILDEDNIPPLCRELLQSRPPEAQQALPINKWLEPAKLHLGSFNNRFPLSPTQREALYHFLIAPEDSVLAVSGPPGTGKTTLLHSVIASLWVKAALAGGAPPLIVASSTNNQAVTNIINSLGGLDDIERWLPISSFGLYLVNSPDKKSRAESLEILTVDKFVEGFPTEIERNAFVNDAIKQYIDACSKYFERPTENVEDGVDALYECLHEKHDLLRKLWDSADGNLELEERLSKVRARVGSVVGYEEVSQQQYEDALDKLEYAKQLYVGWLRFGQEEH